MCKMNDLHIAIAEILLDCATNRKTICYKELCELVHYRKPRVTIGKELEKISMFTFKYYDGIFISALVVQKEMEERGLFVSGDGFFSMYHRECPTDNRDIYTIANEQRERIYAENWQDLTTLIRTEIENYDFAKV